MDLATALAAAGDISDPLDFPPAHEHLRTLDRTLRCAICKDLYDSPVLLSTCGHSYCSFCIRDSLRQSDKKECPMCRTSLQESNLKKNIALEDGVEAYKAARHALLSLATSAEPSLKRRRNDTTVEDPSAGPSKRPRPSPNNSLSENSVRADDASSDVEILEANAAVQCPLCQQQIRMSHLDAHIENGCPEEGPIRNETEGKKEWAKLLGGTGNASKKTNIASKSKSRNRKTEHSARTVSPSAPSRPLAKVSYFTLTLKQIRSLLQDQGLSLEGDRPQWEQRHAQWITLYNANLDSSKPKTLTTLRKDLERWESIRARDERDKKARESRVGTRGYEESQKDEFRKLVQQAKATACRSAGYTNGAVSVSADGSSSGQPIEISSDTEDGGG